MVIFLNQASLSGSMTLYLIGIGLNDEKDISVKGLDIVKKCDKVYLENYTSKLQCSVDDLSKFYGKDVIPLERESVEQEQPFLTEAKDKEVALLIIGDVFSATTHISIFTQAREKGIAVEVINNASVLNAVGIVGLELYKYGKTTSIPFRSKEVRVPYDVLAMNQKNGLHTLFLLDLNPKENSFMTPGDAIEYILGCEIEAGQGIFTEETLCIGCARLGSKQYAIKVGRASEIMKIEFGDAPHCLIIPGKLHFVEEEAIEMWKSF